MPAMPNICDIFSRDHPLEIVPHIHLHNRCIRLSFFNHARSLSRSGAFLAFFADGLCEENRQ